MADIAHQWGFDLKLGPTGDLQSLQDRSSASSGSCAVSLPTCSTIFGTLLRRRVSWVHPPAGQYFEIRAAIRSQIFKETAAAQSPEPTIDVTLAPGGAAETFMSISYMSIKIWGNPNSDFYLSA